MKVIKRILFVFLILLNFVSYAQTGFPVPQNLGSKSTQVHVPGLLVTDSGFVLKEYIDTVAANIAQVRFNGSLIKIDSSLFLYNKNKWVKISNNTINGDNNPQNLQQVTNADSITTHQIIAKSYNASNLPIYESNSDAIAANLKNGDFYYLPYNNGNYLLAIVVRGGVIITRFLLNEDGTIILNEDGTFLIIE